MYLEFVGEKRHPAGMKERERYERKRKKLASSILECGSRSIANKQEPFLVRLGIYY